MTRPAALVVRRRGREALRAPDGVHCWRISVIASLSASSVSVPCSTALRTRVSQGLPGALNACWKFSATGVSPLAATSLIVTSRGSLSEYLLLERSERDTTSLFLASTSTWASSDIIQLRKFQACAAFLESF